MLRSRWTAFSARSGDTVVVYWRPRSGVSPTDPPALSDPPDLADPSVATRSVACRVATSHRYRLPSLVYSSALPSPVHVAESAPDFTAVGISRAIRWYCA